MTACATCTPCGPNSLARLVDRARRANFPVEKEDIRALDFTLAVAPVKIRVGGWVPLRGLDCTWARSKGRACWEKRKAPFLDACVS